MWGCCIDGYCIQISQKTRGGFHEHQGYGKGYYYFLYNHPAGIYSILNNIVFRGFSGKYDNSDSNFNDYRESAMFRVYFI